MKFLTLNMFCLKTDVINIKLLNYLKELKRVLVDLYFMYI